MVHGLLGWLARRADNVAVLLLAATFCLFILQIVSRYVIRQPLGWTLEACLLCWLWLVFWSAAFTLKDQDQVRFSILSQAVSPAIKRVFAVLSGISLVCIFAYSLLPTWDYVSFMAIEKTSLLKLRFDWVFGIYMVFLVAVIVRYVAQIVLALRSKNSDTA